MNSTLVAKADNMISIQKELKSKYRWRANDVSLKFAAFIFSLLDFPFDIDKFDKVIRNIKENTGMFSYYRSTLLYPMAAQLATQFDDPGRSFLQMLEYERRMKEQGFRKTVYLGIAAYALLLTNPGNNLDTRIMKAQELYKRMKEKHYWLTTSDDYAVSVLLAAEDEPVEILIDKMEQHYDMLHEQGFSRSNGLQFLSHLLTFRNEPVTDKVILCKEIHSFLKDNKLSISSMYYGVIGLLALLGKESKNALCDVVDMANYLKESKAFKWYYKEVNIYMISALVCSLYAKESKLQQGLSTTSIGTTIEAFIAAQTAATIAIATAAAASATAGASS